MRRPIRRRGAPALLAWIAAASAAIAGDGPSRPHPTAAFPASIPPRPGSWVAVPAFPKLAFSVPTFLVAEPRGDRLFVGEREGHILAFANRRDVESATVFLDLSAHCQGFGDCGLLGLAFHPEFGLPGSPNRGYVYVFYNYVDKPFRGPEPAPEGLPARNRLARFTVPDGSDAADPASELALIDQEDEHLWHNGGAMFFHPDDGFLYLALGDEGHIDPSKHGNTQRIDKDLFSGVIRIDVDRDPRRSHPPRRRPATGTTAGYFIPDDNPFVGGPGALEEFWCLGLRSPHAMTLDRATGRIFLGDVGDNGAAPCEEVNLIEKGANYQWPYRIGDQVRGDRPRKLVGVERRPLHAYGHTEGNACVIGGYVYRGSEHSDEMGGRYIFGDHGSGRVWAMDADGLTGVPARITELMTLPASMRRGLTAFGVDRRGELYLCVMAPEGRVLKLARAGSPEAPIADARPLPHRLSETGFFTDLATLTPSPGVIPYEINAPAWHDGASARRWIALLPGRSIGYRPRGPWAIPDGTVIAQHLELPTGDGGARRLETRVLVRGEGGSAYGLTYRWRPDGTDADLLDGPATEELTVAAPDREGRSNGDFDAIVRVGPDVDGLTAEDALGRMAAILADRDRDGLAVALRFRVRAAPATPIRDCVRTFERPAESLWVRLRRSGDDLTAYHGDDGRTWTELLTLPVPLTRGVRPMLHAPSMSDTRVPPPPLYVRGRAWAYPSRDDCLACHNPEAGAVLGINARQLHRGDQLLAWDREGLLDPPFPRDRLAKQPRLAPIDDESASLEHRIRSYLDVNCAACHRPAGVRAHFDARFETPLLDKTLIGGALHHDWGVAGAAVVAPGDPDRSIALRRLRSVGADRMPPVGRERTDEAAVRAFADWIADLPDPVATRRARVVLAALVGAGLAGLAFLALRWRRAKPTAGKVLRGPHTDPTGHAPSGMARGDASGARH